MNAPKLGGFKEQKFIVSVLQPEGPHRGLMRARLSLKAPGKPPLHASSCFQVATGIPWLVNALF